MKTNFLFAFFASLAISAYSASVTPAKITDPTVAGEFADPTSITYMGYLIYHALTGGIPQAKDGIWIAGERNIAQRKVIPRQHRIFEQKGFEWSRIHGVLSKLEYLHSNEKPPTTLQYEVEYLTKIREMVLVGRRAPKAGYQEAFSYLFGKTNFVMCVKPPLPDMVTEENIIACFRLDHLSLDELKEIILYAHQEPEKRQKFSRQNLPVNRVQHYLYLARQVLELSKTNREEEWIAYFKECPMSYKDFAIHEAIEYSQLKDGPTPECLSALKKYLYEVEPPSNREEVLRILQGIEAVWHIYGSTRGHSSVKWVDDLRKMAHDCSPAMKAYIESNE